MLGLKAEVDTPHSNRLKQTEMLAWRAAGRDGFARTSNSRDRGIDSSTLDGSYLARDPLTVFTCVEREQQ